MSSDNAGTVDAVKTTPEVAAAVEKAVSPEGSAKPSAEVQKRFDELTAELARKNAKLEAQEKKLREVEEANKTEQEKRIDALIQERTGPSLKRLQAIESAMHNEFEELMKAIPDHAKAAVISGDSVPIEERLRQARAVSALIGKTNGQPFSGGGNPASEAKRQYTREEFRVWQELPGKGAGGIKQYEEMKAEMNAAYREGRIIGI